ncbi:MAG: hypothetical protein J6S51_03540 [Kiritimatiellae bacterium]|nr:hypothetical protein [Kiritimatiellia bacterium]
MKRSRISQEAEKQIRRARSLIARFLLMTKVTKKEAVVLIGEIKSCLDIAGDHYDFFNHYIGENN